MLKALNDILRKQRIQYVLTVLLTVVILYFTSAVWYRGIVLSFNAQADKNIQYQIFYTETPEQDFNEKQSIKKYVIDGLQKVKIGLPIGKIAKLRLAFGSMPERLEISDIQIKGTGRLDLEYNEFAKNEIDFSTVQDGKFIIYSYKDNPYITYKKDLNLVRNNRIDWCRLIIITVLALFFVFKLTKYLVDERYSKIDVILIAVFFALLFLPMSHITDARTSEKEFRVFATKPQFSIYNENKNSYGEQFNEWFSDHFFGRDMMMNIYQNIRYMIAPNMGNNNVLVGKDGWLFFKFDNSMNNYANNVDLSEKNMENGLKYLKTIDEWCKENGKEFYYVIAPDKNKIYGEYYRLIRKQRSNDYGIGKQFTDYIKKNSDIKVIYLYDVLRENKNKGVLYYKHDSHWSELGAYYGYKTLMKLMKMPEKQYEFDLISYNSRKLTSLGYFGVGDLDRLVENYSIQDNNLYYKLKINDRYFCKSYNINTMNNECYNSEGKKNLFMIRDSFGGALLYYLSDNFHKIYTVGNESSITETDLKMIKEDYDIVIFENVERYIPKILNESFPQDFIKNN